MKKANILTIIISVFITAFAAFGQSSPETEIKVDRINPNVVRLAGAQIAVHSPSGRFTAIQVGERFLLLPTADLLESFAGASKIRSREGQIVGFLPSETLVFSNKDEIFGIEPRGQKTRKLLPRVIGERLARETISQNEIVIVSDDLLITGDGDYHMGGFPGNIFRYDLKRKSLKRGAKTKQFWYAALSSSRNYILYERGGEQSNFIDFYDVRRDRNYEAAGYFNFRRAFPKFRVTSAYPLAWVGGKDRFLAYIASGEHPDDIKPEDEQEQSKTWLALLDIPTRKIVWKKLTDQGAFPRAFQPLDDNRLLVNYEEEVFELSLATGKERKMRGVEGESVTVSPDKRKIAFIKSDRLYTASIDGGNQKPILDLPAGWKFDVDYKGMGKRPPMWIGNQTLILFGELQLLIARL